MQLTIDLSKATLKDAEHAIFLIGAYFGMTNLPTAAVVSGSSSVSLPPLPATPVAAAAAQVAQPVAAAPAAPPVENPAAVFGSTPAALPPGAGEAPMTADPAAVFAGNAASPSVPANVATAPVGTPGTPGAAPSAAPVAAPAVVPGTVPQGDAGNAAAGAAGSATSSSAGTTAPVAGGSPVTPAGVELDADGLPWDNRIHASSEGGAKPKNADGRWRKKRGLNDAAYVAQVQAELRQTLAAGTPAAAAPVAPPPPPVVQPQPQVPTPPAVQPPAPPQAQAPAQPQADPTTFEQLMPRITSAVMAGTLPQTALLQAVTAYQLPNIPALATRPDLVPTVWAYLRSMYPALV